MTGIFRAIVVGFFLIGGIAHFAVTDTFVRTMPAFLPSPRLLVLVSGALELLGAFGLLFRDTRRLAGYGLITLCVAVFPANVNMALHPELFPDIGVTLLYLRLPLQALIIWCIWRAALSRDQT